MGIQSINPLFKEISPEAFMKGPITLLSGRAVAIDAHIMIYKYLSTANNSIIGSMVNPLDIIDYTKIRKLAIEKALDFNRLLFEYRITPVWIFDGPPVSAKTKCLIERKDIKKKKIAKIEEKRAELEEKNVLKITKEDYDDFRKVLKNNTKVTMDDVREFHRVFSSIGIPTFTADGDAEKLCSALNREGTVVGVWGTDTDNYALGTPILITEISGQVDFVHQIQLVRLETILSKLQVPLSFITDLCIMCGCDFNDNIPGIGPKRSLDLLRTYGSIDNLPSVYKNKPLDISILDHYICRDAFSYTPSGIFPDQIVIDWDTYLMGIVDVVEQYVPNNKSKFTSFTGW